MPTGDPPVTAVLVIRAWLEHHPDAPLRAVLTFTPDVTRNELETVHAKSVDDVCDAVRTWLDGLARGAADHGPR